MSGGQIEHESPVWVRGQKAKRAMTRRATRHTAIPTPANTTSTTSPNRSLISFMVVILQPDPDKGRSRRLTRNHSNRPRVRNACDFCTVPDVQVRAPCLGFVVRTGVRRGVQIVGGFSRPPNRPLGLRVVLVNVLTGGSWVFPPETPRGGEPPRRAERIGYLAVRPAGGSGLPFRWEGLRRRRGVGRPRHLSAPSAAGLPLAADRY